MDMMGVGRNGDVLKWLQMVLAQSQRPRGQEPVARPYGGMGGEMGGEMPLAAPPPAPDVPEAPAEGGMMPSPMAMANPFDVRKRRRG